MSIPSTHKVFRRTEGDIPRTVQQTTESLPSVEELGPDDVLIKVHAVSLNYRDVAMLNGIYPVQVQDRGIPCSDCAGEVVAIGTSVQDFAVGDRVAPIFDITNFTGLEDEPGRALGGDVAGVLREYAVFKENILVRLPYSLTWEEASTLSCAGVTAWTALEGLQTPRKDAAALMQGTGGVSLFALALCIANGTKAIITSSSDDKLEAVKKLGPDVHGINYKTTLNQRDAILEITNGKGVDYVVNNTGPGSIPDDISFLRGRGGTISLIGFLDGFSGKWEPSAIMALMGKHAKIRGIGVGSKADYQEMNKFIEEKKVNLGPIIDRVFSFDDSKAAFDYLYSGKHTGKVVIKI
ncbi:alcohol dehydrogenase [Plectosphaerella plurivora]|uniref:Alcohol dehydrogenase n=1 Tax=Plectosphaerella plurivora TaxID=936078 RepID=A0A9P8V794_9PEZI|nr:alcohol dehydrogenase [Plectosphaerella plurivora]